MIDWDKYGVLPEHREIALRLIEDLSREPNLIVNGDDPVANAYLYRWHITPRSYDANVYFHLQVASDPERPFHDHPWDNQTVILANGYDELYQPHPPFGETFFMARRVGHTIHRKAKEAHRLILPEQFRYSMSLFTTGPAIRDERGWGFWIGNTWYSSKDCVVELSGNRSVFVYPSGTGEEAA